MTTSTTTTISTSVPDVTITESGLTVPEVADILSGRLTDIVSSLSSSGTPSTSLSSPQGQIAMSDTAIIAQVYDKLAVLMRMINPDYATGSFQDGIGRIYFMERITASGTVVTATCTGAVDTVLPIGSSAQDTAGYIYKTTSEYTIGSDGTVDADFTCQTTGPIVCAAGALSKIYRAVDGWDAVSNDSAGVVGTDIESRIAFETRRKNSVYRNSRNQDGSVLSGLLATDGVLDAYVWSNRTDAAVEKGVTSFSVAAHSTYICVYGGASADIASAIFETANPTSMLNGDTSYTISDTDNYSSNYPTYDITWQTATTTPIYFNITLDSSLSPPSDIISLVQAMVVSVMSGDVDGIDKARIGSTISVGRFYAPIISIDSSTVNISSITVSKDNSTFSSSVTMGIDQVPTIETANITVTLA